MEKQESVMNAKWIRVTRKRRCGICDHPDWCAYSPDLGLVLCMRVESLRPSTNSMGGWIHRVSDPRPSYVPPVRVAIKETAPDLKTLWRRWSTQTDFHHLDGFAMSLEVDADALRAIGCAWNGHAWAFQMKNANDEMIGIRLRSEAGQKWAVTGSKQGLFIPRVDPQNILYVVEGPTDCAAALTLGLWAIGRPSCMGSEGMIRHYVRGKRIRRVVIVTDNDRPDRMGRRAGLSGAERLQKALPVLSCLWIPPTKDLREYLTLGGNRWMIEACIKDLVWTMPTALRESF
jgi:hypothetical protein